MAILEKIIISAEDQATRVLNNVEKSVGGVDGAVKKLGAGFGIYLSARTLIDFSKQAIKSFENEERAITRLNTALKNGGEFNLEMSNSLKKLAMDIQNTTVVSDNMVMSLAATGLDLGITADNIEYATKAAIGLSRVMAGGEGNLEDAMRLVALALQGDTEMLKRAVPMIRQAKDESEAFALFQKAVASGLEQTAAETKTAWGQMEQFKNTLDNEVFENFGQALTMALVPAIQDLSNVLKDKATQDAIKDLGALANILIKIGAFGIGLGATAVKLPSAIKGFLSRDNLSEADWNKMNTAERQEYLRKATTNPYELPKKAGGGTPKIVGISETEKKQAEDDQKWAEDWLVQANKDAEDAMFERVDLYGFELDVKKKADEDAFNNLTNYLTMGLDATIAAEDKKKQATLLAYQTTFSSLSQLGQMWQSQELQVLSNVGEQVVNLAMLWNALGGMKEIGKWGIAGIAFAVASIAAGANIISQMQSTKAKMGGGTGGGGISAPSMPSYSGASGGGRGGDVYSNTYQINGIITDEVWRLIVRGSLGDAFKKEALRSA